jgi:hypothetical protein
MSWSLESLECQEIRTGKWRLEYVMSDPEGNRAELSVLAEGKEVERATLHYKERVYWFAGREAWELLHLAEFGLLGTRHVWSAGEAAKAEAAETGTKD